MEQLIVIGVFLILGYFFGTWLEKKHYISIKEREHKFKSKPCVNLKTSPLYNKEIIYSRLAIGSNVVSIDYAKRFVAGFRLIFGGRLTSYESLLDRARREAILRMKEAHQDADMYLNVKIETASIAKGNAQKNSIGSVEVVAYSTAVKFG